MKSWNGGRTPTNIVVLINSERALYWILDQHDNGYMYRYVSLCSGGYTRYSRGRFVIQEPIIDRGLFAYDHKYKIVRDKWILKNS